MSEQKSLILQLAETYERHRLARSAAAVDNTVAQKSRRLHTFLRWMVPNGGTILLVLVLILTQQAWARPLQQQMNAPGPSATTVNYQGRLADPAGNPLDGNYAMSFALYATDSGGSPVWGPEAHPAVPVSGGLFSVGLGSQTSGGIPTTTWDGDRYLEITVGGETLSPRELIRSVPIAGMALTVPDGAIGSGKLDLDYETLCRTSDVQVTLPGGGQEAEVPGLRIDFTLENPSTVLVWIDGTASFDQAGVDQSDVRLYVDSIVQTSGVSWDDYAPYSVKGQRIITLDAGAHSMYVHAYSHAAGTMTVYGYPAYRTCVNYLVLGGQ